MSETFQDPSIVESHIRVLIRVRPLMSHEHYHSTSILTLPSPQLIQFILPKQDSQMQTSFQFDAVLGPDGTQEDVFERGKVADMVYRVVQGFNSTIFAYGQTGSGKTFTMEGHVYKAVEKKGELRPSFEDTPEFQYGICIRSVQLLFQMLNKIVETDNENEVSTKTYVVRCSFCQIYNENVYDLLVPDGGANTALKVRWDSRRDFYVENLYTFEVKNANDALRLYRHGIARRVVASHKMNSASSRSHCLFELKVEQVDASMPEDIVVSKLVLVDLAGSERTALTGATGLVLNQSIGINKSLFTLRKVISSLAQNVGVANNAHIPYRDSILTRLLKQSLGGNSLTLMIACIAPSDNYVEENLITLNYASLASRISNVAVVNEDPKTRLIRQLRAQVSFLMEQLKHSRQVYVSDSSGFRIELTSEFGDNSVEESHAVVQNELKTDNGRIDGNRVLKDLIDDNNSLRWALQSQASLQDQREFENYTLNRENEGLRERIGFLESIIVGEQEELLDSITDPSKWSTTTSLRNENELKPEYEDFKAENKRLRALVQESAAELQKVQNDLVQSILAQKQLMKAPIPKKGSLTTSRTVVSRPNVSSTFSGNRSLYSPAQVKPAYQSFPYKPTRIPNSLGVTNSSSPYSQASSSLYSNNSKSNQSSRTTTPNSVNTRTSKSGMLSASELSKLLNPRHSSSAPKPVNHNQNAYLQESKPSKTTNDQLTSDLEALIRERLSLSKN